MRVLLPAIALVLSVGCAQLDALPSGADLAGVDLPELQGSERGFSPDEALFTRFQVILEPAPGDTTGLLWQGIERNTIENADGAIGCSIEWEMTGDFEAVPDDACVDCQDDVAISCADARIAAGDDCGRYYSPVYLQTTMQWWADFRYEYTDEEGIDHGTVWSRGIYPGAEWHPFVQGMTDGERLWWDERHER